MISFLLSNRWLYDPGNSSLRRVSVVTLCFGVQLHLALTFSALISSVLLN